MLICFRVCKKIDVVLLQRINTIFTELATNDKTQKKIYIIEVIILGLIHIFRL